MPASIGTVHLTVIVDRAALDRAKAELAEKLNGVIADPVIVAEAVEQIMRRGPLVRYIMEPGNGDRP